MLSSNDIVKYNSICNFNMVMVLTATQPLDIKLMTPAFSKEVLFFYAATLNKSLCLRRLPHDDLLVELQ